MKKYVTGFLFSNDTSKVVLIKKINPQWQKGLFNGVGGKIEVNELSVDAMVREFEEEAGVVIAQEQWRCYVKIHRPNCYDLDVYFAHSDLAFEARTIEREQIQLFDTHSLPKNLIPNLKWLIPMALDKEANFNTPVLIQEVDAPRAVQ